MKARNVIGTILQIIAMLVAIYPVIKWIQDPTQTEMQIFLSYWWMYLLCVGVFYTGSFIKK